MTSARDGIPVVRRPRLLGGARVRILAGMLLLLVASEGIALFAQREILRARAGERVDDALVQEVDEFRTLVRLGRNPNSGERFGGDVAAMFDVFLTRNVPGEGEAVFTFLGTEPYRSTVGDPRSQLVGLHGGESRARPVRFLTCAR